MPAETYSAGYGAAVAARKHKPVDRYRPPLLHLNSRSYPLRSTYRTETKHTAAR